MKRVGTILISVMLAICMAIGLTACGDKSGNGGNNGGNNGGGNETPATPTVTCDVNNLLLVKNEKVNVTATVANSEKAASFSLAPNDKSVVALKVSESTPNVATIEAIADGTATLTVALEGATSVTVPITVDGMVGITGDILDQTKVLDAGTTGQDDGETSALQVRHYMGGDYKLEVTNANENVAALTGEAGAYSVKAKQAGVSEITVTLLGVKEEQKPQEPEEGVEPTEEVEPEQPEQPEEPVYEEVFKKTISVVCTDDWDKAAKEDEVSSKLLSFKEVTGGYAAYVDATIAQEDEDFMFDLSDMESVQLRVPAVYNGKPVVTLAPCQIREFGLLEAYFLGFGENTTGEDLEIYKTIYGKVKEVYLPCTLTEIPALAFRRAVVSKVEVQKGNHIATIGTQAVNESVNLVSFNLEDCRELKTIRARAFTNNGNAGLSLIIPNSVETIEKNAFLMANLQKVEFEAAAKNDNGEYVPSITFETNGPNAASGVFHAATITTITLRNIKNFYGVMKGADGNPEKYQEPQPDGTFIEKVSAGGDYVAQTAIIKSFVIGEDVLQSKIQNGAHWIFAFLFTNGSNATLTLEGANNDVAQKVQEWSGVDNCGCLFGFAAFTSINPVKVYIHKDIVKNGKVGSLITTRYNQNADYSGEGAYADYTEWTVKPTPPSGR